MNDKRDVNHMGKEALRQEVLQLRKQIQNVASNGDGSVQGDRQIIQEQRVHIQRLLAEVLGHERAIEQIPILFKQELVPLMQEYTWRFANMKELIGRFDELAQGHRGQRTDTFTNRLKIISADLGGALTSYRNVVEQITGMGVEVTEAPVWFKTALIVQDYVAAYLRGKIPKAQLATVYRQLPGNLEYSKFVQQVKWGGHQGPSPERLYFGKRIHEICKLPGYKGRGAVLRAALALKEEIQHEEHKTPEEEATATWFKAWDGDDRRLSQEASRAKRDYESLVVTTSPEVVTTSLAAFPDPA